MTRLFGAFPEIVIALVLVIIAGVLILLARMKLLPKKSWPFIAAALLGIGAWSLFRKRREDSLRADLKRREAELKALEERLAKTRTDTNAADAERQRAAAELQRQREALQKEILLTRAGTDAEIDRINRLHGEDLFREFEGPPQPRNP